MLNRLLILLFALLTISAGCSPRPSAIPTKDLPPPFSPEALNFIVVGDWGRDGFFNQQDVADQMGETAGEILSRFVISTGDNFYPSGVENLNDFKWVTSFERIYTAPSLRTPWYVVLGNHDWRGNVDAQIEYSAYSDMWTMPDRYYAREIPVTDSLNALFVFIDTTPIADADHARIYPQSERWRKGRQLQWIDSTLAASDAPWKIVVGHHPVYVASSKYEDNPDLIRDLVPIMERHGVQAYFAGHDHNLQHLRVADSDINYFVSGAGSLTRGVDRDDPHALFALRVPGFMAVSLTAEVMFVKALDEHGHLYYFTNVPVGDEPESESALAAEPQTTNPGTR